MVRTKADSVPGTYRKAVAAAAPRKSLGASISANALSSSQAGTPAKSKFAGGNPVCPRPTPTWQKGIGDFFGGPSRKPDKENHLPQSDDEEAGVSGVSKSSRISLQQTKLWVKRLSVEWLLCCGAHFQACRDYGLVRHSYRLLFRKV
ncbi:PCNA-associated factor-like isoform X1 [Oncorhynchus keta]|uniref:PCNA-associated factor-like isoform X1 n=1 Tax=Oncorhynchus keta TaxID=8018 RepID=UPI0015F82B35|nr:PCNA-associated factor-like isoform X1 [Oncorhynchus keta]